MVFGNNKSSFCFSLINIIVSDYKIFIFDLIVHGDPEVKIMLVECVLPEHENLKNTEIPVQVQAVASERKYRVVYRAPVPGILCFYMHFV